MINLIKEAIKNKQILSFSYDGMNRVVEPHALGITSKENTVLRCYQIQGGHKNNNHTWDLCSLKKIVNLSTTGNTFIGPRLGYKKGDKAMITILAEL